MARPCGPLVDLYRWALYAADREESSAEGPRPTTSGGGRKAPLGCVPASAAAPQGPTLHGLPRGTRGPFRQVGVGGGDMGVALLT